MQGTPKVVVVGAGSASFGLPVLKGLAECPDLSGISLVLHDIDAPALERMGPLAGLLVQAAGPDRQVEWTCDRGYALDGADVVILSVAADRERTWARDRDDALALGIDHYAENGGPGALFHTARNLEIILPIVRDMERLCPDAWLLNYTNPVPRVCTAIARASSIRCLGVCHQLGFGYYMAGTLLADVLGIPLPPDPRFRWTDAAIAVADRIRLAAEPRLRLEAFGLNHFTWATRVTHRQTGEDLYPLLRERNRTFDPAFEPLTRKLFDLFDLFPVPGDCHLAEYLPYTHSPTRGTWQRYDIQMYDFAWAEQGRRQRADFAHRVLAERNPALLAGVQSERAERLVAALLGRTESFEESINLPNVPHYGARDPKPQAPSPQPLPDLPETAVVEVPATISARGVVPVPGTLPLPILELVRRQTAITELTIQGLLEQRRDLLVQALALDPMVDDPELPDALLRARNPLR